MARELWIMRHAQAMPEVRGGRDFDRPLSDHGHVQARWMAEHVPSIHVGASPSWVLHSSALRTTQTAEVTFADATLIPESSLYEAGVDGCLSVIQEQAADQDLVALVGHNPTVHAFATWLSGDEAIAASPFSPATLVIFEFEGSSWSTLGPRSCNVIAMVSAPEIR